MGKIKMFIEMDNKKLSTKYFTNEFLNLNLLILGNKQTIPIVAPKDNKKPESNK